jgi:hypothetical protein
VNAAGRLAVFSLILAAAFVAAAAIGRAVGPLEREAAQAEHAEEAEGLALQVVRRAPALAFRIVGAESFDVLHERRMHLIVVRRDLTGFQHLHPRLGADGIWSIPLRLPAAGTYVAFADFSADGARATIPFDLHAPGAFEPRPLPAPARVATVGGYRVTLRRRAEHLEFDVRRGGRAVRIDPYLGARGHLVVLRQGDLAYVHSHAELDELAFEPEFPSPGRYRLFLQFKTGGVVHTAEFTVAR